MNRPRIALIHALEESVVPVRDSFARLWPDAYAFDLLDTSLAVDRARQGRIDEAMIGRFRTLADYARTAQGEGGQTQAILFTCSAFGPAIEAVRAALPVPVLKPNEAAFEAALERGSTLGLVVTFEPSLGALTAELQQLAALRGKDITVRAVCADGALAALKAGDGPTHDRLAAEAAQTLDAVDAVILGQFSLARARAAVSEATGRPVLTTPDSAVEHLRTLLG